MLTKKQKRALISIPIIIIAVPGLFTLFDWLLGADHDTIVRAFRTGLVGALCGSLLPVLSLLFNWPMNLRDEEVNLS